MKAFMVLIVLGLAVAGCTVASDEDQLENAIRDNLSNQGSEVKQVEMTRQGDNHFTGFAEVRERSGREGRLNCTADRRDDQFHFQCAPAIDERVVRDIENQMRPTLAQQGEVLELHMERRDDNHMTGFTRIRPEGGEEVRLDCTAERQNGASFNWNCNPAGAQGGGQAAPSEGSAAPAGDQGAGEATGGEGEEGGTGGK